MSCTLYAFLVPFPGRTDSSTEPNNWNRATECNFLYLTTRPGSAEVCNHFFN
jgi:hypothetical protein